jgi:hypothetical protein
MVPVRLGSRYYIVSPGSLSSSKANSARWPHSIRSQCIVKRVSPAARAWAMVFDGNCGIRGLCTKPFLGCVFPHRFFLIARLSIQQPDGTGMLEKTMTSPTFFRLAATLDQLPSFRGMDLWGRFVRCAFWGRHAQQSYY